LRLFKQNIVSARQLDATRESLNEIQGKLDVVEQNAKTLEAELSVLQGALTLAETNLSYAKLVAPYDCVVCEKRVYPGDLAAPGKVLMHIERTGALKTVFMIPQSDMKSVELGDELVVRFRKRSTTAKISKIYPSVGSDKMIRMEARLSPDAGNEFVSGQYVRITLNLGSLENVMIIPSDAINLDNNSTKKTVFVLRSGKLRQVAVDVIADNQQEAAVKGDLKPGEKVVVSAFLGWAELADGVKAEVLSK
jgi:multidrug efflux system membrane fusion protein